MTESSVLSHNFTAADEDEARNTRDARRKIGE
jgi:hypothetical protein